MISGPDSITSDAHGFKAFLEPEEAEYKVELIFFKQGEIILRLSKSTLKQRRSPRWESSTVKQRVEPGILDGHLIVDRRKTNDGKFQLFNAF
jgi:hypothetical protein